MTTEVESIITIAEVEGAELFHHYRGQTSPQPCYVSLNCEGGDLVAEYSGEIGNGVPFRVYHGRVRRWRIPALTAEAANALLAEIAPIAETLIAGYACEWDGSNHVGELDESAAEADEAIRSLCDRDWDGQTIEVWDACDWFGGDGDDDHQCRLLGITAETTDADLLVIAAREESNAHPRILTGALSHLTTLRDHAIDAAAEGE
jgi:hypothetical protein